MSDKLIQEWYQLQAEIDANRQAMTPKIAREMELRKQLLSTLWPTPIEGVNKYDLPNGFVLKGTYKVDRKVDKAALPAVQAELTRLNVIVDTLVRYDPALETKAYRKLSDEHRLIFDQALIIRPAAPVLELVAPKPQ